MNALLKEYLADVRHPHVSGAEHLEMLQAREQLAALQHTFSSEEKKLLDEADRLLIAQADEFATELARFTNLVEARRTNRIPPSHWWWYLDVISHLPASTPASAVG